MPCKLSCWRISVSWVWSPGGLDPPQQKDVCWTAQCFLINTQNFEMVHQVLIYSDMETNVLRKDWFSVQRMLFLVICPSRGEDIISLSTHYKPITMIGTSQESFYSLQDRRFWPQLGMGNKRKRRSEMLFLPFYTNIKKNFVGN